MCTCTCTCTYPCVALYVLITWLIHISQRWVYTGMQTCKVWESPTFTIWVKELMKGMALIIIEIV